MKKIFSWAFLHMSSLRKQGFYRIPAFTGMAGIFIICLLLFPPLARADNLTGQLIGTDQMALSHQTLISGIGISGNYPYPEGKVRRYLTVRPGDPFYPNVLNEQAERIEDFYKRDGWMRTQVNIVPEFQPATKGVYLHVKIRRGFLLRYRNISVTGDYSLPKSIVASKVNTWSPYKPRKLREAINKIVHVYRMKGYPLARARVVEENIDENGRTIDITVNIEEGPKVEVVFIGNKHLGGKVLKETLTIFKEGAIDTFELEESAKAIKKRYTIRGFPNASVKFSREDVDRKNIRITFLVDEGAPQRVRSVDFSGNKKMKAQKIRGRMVTKGLSLTHQGIYDKKVLKNDLIRIDYLYRTHGFPNAKAREPEIEKLHGGTQLKINIPIDEGEMYTISDIRWSGDIPFAEKRLIKALKSRIGEPLNFMILDDEKLAVKSFYGDNGYPYAEVSLDVEKDADSGTAVLTFNVTSGCYVTFGPITISGDFLTSQKAIRRAMSIREGEPFSFEKIISSKIGLRRLDAFSSVEIDAPGLEQKESTVGVNVKVEEMRPFKLDFDLGFSTDELFVGGIDFMNRNAFGWGKQAIFRLIGGRRFSRGEIGWNDPNLAGSDIEMSLAGWLQHENRHVFSYVQAGGGVGFYRRYHRTSFLVRNNMTRNYLISGSSTAADAESLRNNTIINSLLSASFDTRNNFADPTSGIYINGYADFFNEIKGKNARFVKFGTLDGLYFTIAKRFTVANNLRLENIQTFGSNISVPSNELFLLGGDDTIRGFDRDSLGPVNARGQPTGGRLRFICNNELRIGIVGNFKWIIFHDMGFLTNDYSSVNLDALRHSIGFGLHYITPIGPIKADYGFIADRKPGEHIGRFHLTFGYTF